MAIENQLFADFSWDVIKILIDHVIEERGEDSIKTAITNQYGNSLPEDWYDVDKPETRIAIGKASISNNWYKRIDHGELIGSLWSRNQSTLNGKNLGLQFEALTKWIDNA